MKYIPSLIEIECAVVNKFKQPIALPNISWGFGIHECDLLIISSSGYATEVEIKRSKADLKKDALKSHGHNSNRIKYLYFAITENIESCIDLIPQRAGVIIIRHRESTPYYPEYIWAEVIKHPEENKEARKLTDTEILKLTRLGCLRIWTLKSKLKRYIKEKRTA